MQKVTFWRQQNNQIVAQKNNLFFAIPLGSGFGEDKASRTQIAEHFDTAPGLARSMNICGAEVIDTIEVA